MKRTSTKKCGGKVKPKVRRGLTKALEIGLPIATSLIPQIAPLAPVTNYVARKYSKRAVDKMGDKLGFGVKKGFKLSHDYSQLQKPYHPAMSPVLPLPDFSKPNFTTSGTGLVARTGHPKLSISRGGSFLPAGY